MFVATEAIELFTDPCNYVSNFENIFEVLRLVGTIGVSIAVGVGHPHAGLLDLIRLVNIVKVFGMLKYCHCTSEYFANALRILKCFFFAAIMVALVGLLVMSFHHHFRAGGIVIAIIAGIIGFLLAWGQGFLTWGENVKRREMLQAIYRAEKLMVCRRKQRKSRFLHTCEEFTDN